MRKMATLLLLLAACDQKPTPEKAIANVQQTKEARLKESEGKTFYAALPLDITEANFAHARRDCPPHAEDLKTMGRGADANKKMFKEITLVVKGGKFFDGAGKLHEPLFCNRCYR